MGIKLIVFMKLKIYSYDRMIVPPFEFSPLYAYNNISNLTDDRGRYLFSGKHPSIKLSMFRIGF